MPCNELTPTCSLAPHDPLNLARGCTFGLVQETLSTSGLGWVVPGIEGSEQHHSNDEPKHSRVWPTGKKNKNTLHYKESESKGLFILKKTLIVFIKNCTCTDAKPFSFYA